MNKFLIMCGIPILAMAQMPLFQIEHYLSSTNATVREAFLADLSSIGSPFSLEVALMKSASMVSGRGELEADFSFFANSASIDDLFDFDGDDLEWNSATAVSSNRTSARIFHPSCYGILRGESALNAIKMEFTSELKDLENYNPASVIMTRYDVMAQRIDVAADGVAQTRQSSMYAAQTPLHLIAGSPAQNDQAIYDVTITLANPSGDMLPFSLARVGGPGFCIDDDDLESDDETRLITIPSQSSASFLLSNVVAGNWAILLDSMTGMRNQTYTFTASAALKSADRSGWDCGRFGYCSLVSNTRSNPTEGSTVNNPTVIGDDRSSASQLTIGVLFMTLLAFLSLF